MPRRIPDYADAYTGWNVISSYGSLISVFKNPISSDYCSYGLEWTIASPTPLHYLYELPKVTNNINN
ncbi:cytochrome c oxidase subunit 1 (mitochondrion) [Zancudomyces culisetae]|uniref:Cytochrome c oxidase subunit 1 n=1 Tax=Zancudomyces culisetae TaxID=1213189 RepID=A0A1R1PDI2_ZANCU|nr:cytochrome c oxidase subunit 1 [Zancudomyces culisetae]|eukprot:OMH78983.1 cytochrome c oxidase subunit 1 (mitochondrion) [Zancudomyces culisetae]